MTERQQELITKLRFALAAIGFPETYEVDHETMEAAETAILENLKRRGLPEIIECGKHGPYFKGAQLVTECPTAPKGSHIWARRRDGRQCAYCEKREFGDFGV